MQCTYNSTIQFHVMLLELKTTLSYSVHIINYGRSSIHVCHSSWSLCSINRDTVLVKGKQEVGREEIYFYYHVWRKKRCNLKDTLLVLSSLSGNKLRSVSVYPCNSFYRTRAMLTHSLLGFLKSRSCINLLRNNYAQNTIELHIPWLHS